MVLDLLMNFQQLKTFCTVLNERSMTAAAQKLFLTQPAVSQQIRQLEDYIGVELLVRGVRKIKPTPQGELLYDYAQRIMNLSDQAELAIQTMGAQVSGPLRVGTLNSVGLHLIGPVFSMFLKSNNEVRLQVRYGKGHKILELLESGDVDIAVIPDSSQEYGGEPKDCDKFVLGDTEMWLVASPKDSAADETISIKDLGSRPMIQIAREYPGFESFLQKEMKRAGLNIRPVFESSNVGTLKRVIETGVGWGFLPSHSIKKQIQTGRLKRVFVEEIDYKMDMVCYRPKTRAKDPTTEVFLKALSGMATGNSNNY